MTLQPSDLDILDSWIPDNEAIHDLKSIIESDSRSIIEFDDGDLSIPTDCEYEIVIKVAVKHNLDEFGFGTGLRVYVAIGGVKEYKNGFLQAKYCFATLWYNSTRDLITCDFSEEFPI